MEGKTSPPPLCVAVIGNTGAGKSTFANTICGSDAKVSGSIESCTAETFVHKGVFQDGSEGKPAERRQVHIVDTPGLGDTQGRDTLNIAGMVDVFRGKAIHLFCLVVNSANCRFSETDKAMLAIFSEIFGTDFLKNCIVVFTNWESGDEADEMRKLEDRPSTSEIQEAYRQEVRDALNYHRADMLHCVFVDNLAAPGANPRLRDSVQRADMVEKIRCIRDLCEQNTPFKCTDVKEAMGMLDRVKDQLSTLRVRNEEMKAVHLAEAAEHRRRIQALRDEMESERQAGEAELSRLRSGTASLQAEAGSSGGRRLSTEDFLLAALIGVISRRGGGGLGPPPMFVGGGDGLGRLDGLL